MPTKKNINAKKNKFRSISNKPEEVFKVVAKKQKAIIKTPKKRRKKLTLHTTVSRRIIIISIATTLLISGVILSYSGKKMLDALHETNRPAGSLELSSEAAANLKLLGSKSQYPNEIINFQSAPVDLQEFVLRDYTLHKANCIVNGQFVSPVRYEIVNVVYDQFARISKDCNGADTIILAKISGIWTVIVSGNDLPTCKDVNAFGIPQGISYKCRDGFVTYTNPNP